MSAEERARLNILQAIQDLNAHSETAIATTKRSDREVGDLSRYTRSNTKILQSLLRDGLIRLDYGEPMKVWMTPRGEEYLHNELHT